MEYKITENTDANRFEMPVDGYVPYIEYSIKADKIYLTHTIVPKELGGRGIGSALVKQVLAIIQNRQLKVVPVCSFVEAYIDKHPEWEVLL